MEQTRIEHYQKKCKSIAEGQKVKLMPDGRVLKTISREKGGLRVLICTNDADEWLLDLIHYFHPSGIIQSSTTIIKKDLKQYLHLLQREGYQMEMISNKPKRTKFSSKMKLIKAV